MFYTTRLLAAAERFLADTFATGRMYFVLGPIREQNSPVTLTPFFQGQPVGEIMAALTLTDSQDCPLSVAFVDKKGQAAPVDGAAQWLTSNSEVIALAPADDGLSCVISAVGPLGTATVSVTADADLGDGVTSISGSVDVTVIAGAAVTVDVTPGTPTEQT